MDDSLLLEINRTLIYGAHVDGFIADIKPVVDVRDKAGNIVASISPQDKYIHFNDNIIHFCYDVPLFKKLMESGYDSNHTQYLNTNNIRSSYVKAV